MDLPDEVLDDVLGRVPPRHLAACRRVCKNWRAVIDGRGLVLAYLAPRPLRGIFINCLYADYPVFGELGHDFFSRNAPTSHRIASTLRFLPARAMRRCVLDHHNGLLLYAIADAMYVCNPVTRRWATLPPLPVRRPFCYRGAYLLFDPAVSLHYDVLYFPDVPERPKPPSTRRRKRSSSGRPPSLKSKYEHEVNTVGSMEWPPYSYAVLVFSSRSGQWQERHFIRQGNAAVTVSDVWSVDRHAEFGWRPPKRHAVYWQGAFYLHCGADFVVRLSLLDRKYQVIKTPTLDNFLRWPYGYFGKSKQGIYYTAVHGYQLSAFVLQEEASNTSRTLEWELRHQADLEPSFQQYYNRHPRGDEIGKSWTLDTNEEESGEGGHGWDSSDDKVTDDAGEYNNEGYLKGDYGMSFLGYHPDKEIVFLHNRHNGFAYYLGTSKLHCMGSLDPMGLYTIPHVAPTLESFIYTPCVDDLLPCSH